MRATSEFMLLGAAAIWGFAFVAQVTAMQHVEPFAFNSARFALGALSLLPVAIWLDGRQKSLNALVLSSASAAACKTAFPAEVRGGLIAGLFLFGGASLQQVGLLYTSASNAGFITGLYIILVPLVGIFLGQKATLMVWVGASLAVGGLYALCIRDSFTLSYGDSLQLAGAFCWAGHVLCIGHFSQRCNALKLAISQYVVCALLSGAVAVTIENTTLQGLLDASGAIAYAGIMSVGIAYTLQIIGQLKVPATRAAVIISLEAVFAAFGGWLLLNEQLDSRALLGCALMLVGMIVAQIPARAAPAQKTPASAGSAG
jgi:drug/metabolite transporter (DMT)-like permease